MTKSEPEHWKKLDTKLVEDCRIFKVTSVTFEHESRKSSGDFFVLDTPDWCHVIAITADRRVIMVKQFRFGTESLSWEVPGGLMEPGENALEAAQRELKEETGYEGTHAELIAAISPNPAIQNNMCHFVLVRDAELRHELDWDEHEEILTDAIPFDEAIEWARSGKIFHSLSINALFFLQKYIDQ